METWSFVFYNHIYTIVAQFIISGQYDDTLKVDMEETISIWLRTQAIWMLQDIDASQKDISYCWNHEARSFQLAWLLVNLDAQLLSMPVP